MGNCFGIFGNKNLTEPLIDRNEREDYHRYVYPVPVPPGRVAVSMYDRSGQTEGDSPERLPRNIVLSRSTYNALVNGDLE